MRAIYQEFENFVSVDEIFTVSPQNFHHLANVVRINIGEDVLILDGNGKIVLAKVISKNKKIIELQIKEIKSVIREEQLFDVYIGRVKKEYYELIIRNGIELGLDQIQFFDCEFSQKKFLVPSDRLNSIVESAMIQSNNPFKIKINDDEKLSEIDFSKYNRIFYFTLSKKVVELQDQLPLAKVEKKDLILIGPEGGLSENEESLLLKLPNTVFINLPSFILRTVTALPTAVGYYWGQKNKLVL